MHYRKDHKGPVIGAEAIVVCLCVLCKATHYRCRIMNIVHERDARVQEVLKNGAVFQKRKFTQLLHLLVDHDCEECVGSQYPRKLMDIYHLSDRRESLPPTRPFGQVELSPELKKDIDRESAMSMTLSAEAIRRACNQETSSECRYFGMCRRFLRSLKISGTAYIISNISL